MYELRTNEWINAELRHPWKRRFVLCHMSDSTYKVLMWNGMYWVNQQGVRLAELTSKVTHFYIFERWNENDIIDT